METAKQRTANGERTLVTTLTKRLAEDLSSYLADQGISCRYLHSDIETLDRIQILRELREGEYDVLVGVNLLREGLDLPEVSLVAIMDADKAGFLRSETSLIQQIGRAARNVNAMVLLYADKVTPAMQSAIDETNRRRKAQVQHNEAHGIEPHTVRKAIRRGIELDLRARKTAREAIQADDTEFDRNEMITELEKQMLEAATALEFERAASLRDRVKALKDSPDIGKTASDKDKPGSPGRKTRRRRGAKH
jgi:excinuclease ABC subunit B